MGEVFMESHGLLPNRDYHLAKSLEGVVSSTPAGEKAFQEKSGKIWGEGGKKGSKQITRRTRGGWGGLDRKGGLGRGPQ